jgi:hypothetical protein
VRVTKTPSSPRIIAKRTSAGNISLTTKRKPKWITAEEFGEVSRSLELKQRELWLLLKQKGFLCVRDSAEGAALTQTAKENL